MAKSGLFGTGANVGSLRQTPIQPTGIPGGTFVQAQRRESGNNAIALAQALGTLNSSLQTFAAVQQKNEEDPQSRANKEWIAKRQQMSIEDLRNEARQGTHDGMRVREDALNTLLGERANDDFRKRWLEFYNTEFDRTSGNAAEAYEQMRQEYAAGLPSEISRGNFYRLTGDHFRSWMEKDTEEKVSYVKQEVATTVVDSFRNAVEDARSKGPFSPEAAAQMVFAKSAENRDFLGMSGQEQNDTIFRLAEEYALQGDEDMARALLEGARTGADGKAIPPIVKIAGYTDKGLRLLEGASEIRRKKVQEDGLQAFIADYDLVSRGAFTKENAEQRKGSGLYTDAQLSNMVDRSNRNRASAEAKAAEDRARRDRAVASERAESSAYAEAYGIMGRLGGINRIRDIEIPSLSGEGTRKLSRETVIDAVVGRKEEEWADEQARLMANDIPPEQARATVNRMRVDWYAGNGLVNEQWANTLNGIAGRATTDTMLQKGEVSDYLKQSAGLYRQLRATNPAYLSRVLTDKGSKDFLEAYDRAILHRRMPEEEALVHAAIAVSQPEGMKARSMMSPDATADLANRTLSNLELDDRSTNRAFVVDRISSMSMLGATEREIKREIEREILESAVPINGMLVFAHSDLPDDFPDLMETFLKERFAAFGEKYGISDVSDLYVAADSTGTKWHVLSKSLMGTPVGADPITSKSLEALRKRRAGEREERIRDLARATGKERDRRNQQFKAIMAGELERIAYWEDLARSRSAGGIRQSLAASVAKKLRENREERLTGAKWRAFKEIVGETHDKQQKDSQKRYEENLEFLKSFLPEVKIDGKDAYEMYRNRSKFNSFDWAADAVGGWFD